MKQPAPTRVERLIDGIATFSGSLPFLLLNFVVFVAWIGINTLGAHSWRFDPFPYQFLTMAVSLEAIFLSLFVLMSQRRQDAHNQRMVEQDFKTNQAAKKELDEMKRELHETDREILAKNEQILAQNREILAAIIRLEGQGSKPTSTKKRATQQS